MRSYNPRRAVHPPSPRLAFDMTLKFLQQTIPYKLVSKLIEWAFELKNKTGHQKLKDGNCKIHFGCSEKWCKRISLPFGKEDIWRKWCLIHGYYIFSFPTSHMTLKLQPQGHTDCSMWYNLVTIILIFSLKLVRVLSVSEKVREMPSGSYSPLWLWTPGRVIQGRAVKAKMPS